ncbi:MAG: hypothetical protein Q8Q94_01880 [bacterium]|nr:hypothetical protein [bacterium]
MSEYLVERMRVVVDQKTGKTELHLRAEGASLTLVVKLSKEQGQELYEKLRAGFYTFLESFVIQS